MNLSTVSSFSFHIHQFLIFDAADDINSVGKGAK